MKPLGRILMATDFSSCSKDALDHAAYLARNLGAELHLLHVFELPLFLPSGVSIGVRPEVHQWIGEAREAAKKALDELAGEIRRGGVKVRAEFREGIPYLEIVKAAGEMPADLVVLGTHGRTGLAHVLLGSVAERVVRKSPCPVLSVRPRGPAGSPKGEDA